MKIRNIQNLDYKKWPKNTLKHINKGGHYVYFNSGYNLSSFLTTNNFQTQFGREVVFENELLTNKQFKTKINNLKDKNKLLEIWRWQNYLFEENILQTLNNAKKAFKILQEKYKEEYYKYSFELI